MPAPLAKGVIIAASVIVAAGIAAYENPQLREWFERSTRKLAMAIRSFGDDLQSRPPFPRRQDPSMREDADEKAEERRRQARAEILERGRIMEERRKRRKVSIDEDKSTPSFDNLVDDEGMLRKEVDTEPQSPFATSTAAEMIEDEATLRSRNVFRNDSQLHQSVDSPLLLRQLHTEEKGVSPSGPTQAWESRYEQELRRTWNISLPQNTVEVPSSHASESLIDLTPTTEDFPDPDISIPSAEELDHPLDRTQYFSASASQTSRTLSEIDPDNYYAHTTQPMQTLEPRPISRPEIISMPTSSAASAAGSAVRVSYSDAGTDDDFSDFGDGIRTPASAWTEVGSSVSGD